MRVFFFHLMPWPDAEAQLGPDENVFIRLSNRLYDPVRGVGLYNTYLDQLEHAEGLGFDGVCVNEHHQNAYGTMPSPNLMAAALARRTRRMQIAIVGNAIPLREHPLRLAEEIAMLDVLSGGRMVSGFVRGVGDEYHNFNLNPADSRARFQEGLELIVRAWTERGPFAFHGEHFDLRYVNIWPRPLQQPHPPIWLPSQGSQETIELAARADRRYPFLQTFSGTSSVKKAFDALRAEAGRNGYRAGPDQIGWAVPIYVAPSDAEARADAEQPLTFFFNRLIQRAPYQIFPPGYVSERSYIQIMESKVFSRVRPKTWDELVEEGWVVVGSPDTVARRLAACHRELGFGLLVGMFHFWSLPHELTLRNLELFAREVLPRIRHLDE